MKLKKIDGKNDASKASQEFYSLSIECELLGLWVQHTPENLSLEWTKSCPDAVVKNKSNTLLPKQARSRVHKA